MQYKKNREPYEKDLRELCVDKIDSIDVLYVSYDVLQKIGDFGHNAEYRKVLDMTWDNFISSYREIQFKYTEMYEPKKKTIYQGSKYLDFFDKKLSSVKSGSDEYVRVQMIQVEMETEKRRILDRG